MRRTVPLLLLLCGCTAAKATFQVVTAEQALADARRYEADRVAVYEYTMALRYLEKAREEIGYSDYRIADALARQSAVWADRSIIFTERHGRTEIQLDDFSDTAPIVAPPAVPPPDFPPATPQPGDELFAPKEPVVVPAPEPAPAPAPAPKNEFEFDVEEEEVEIAPK